MNSTDFKVYQKFLSRNKLYTAVSIVGFAVSLMFVILIAAYTYQELSTDRFQQKADRIYLLGSENGYGTAYRIADRIKERYPEIEKVCPMAPWTGTPVEIESNKLNVDLLFADSTFFDMFSFQLVEGNIDQVLLSQNNVVVSETFARKAYGDKNPIGQTIKLKDYFEVTISGVMKDIKNSTIPYCDILVRMDNIKHFNSSMDSPTFDNAGSACIFILAKEGTDMQAKAVDMAAFFKEIFWLYKRGIVEKVTFTPLKEVYFPEAPSLSFLNQGNWSFVMILMSVGIVILLFAVINYINLSVAQTAIRAKEMATRRLLGSSRKDLFARLMFESICLTLICFLFGLLLTTLVVPYADILLASKIDLGAFASPISILLCLAATILLGVISGIVPATIISRSNPLDVVKGTFRRKNKMVFSRIFITFQNAITIMLIVASITMVLQTRHLINAPLGYDVHNKINIYNTLDDLQRNKFVDDIKQLACVKRVAFSNGTPSDGGNNLTTEYEGRNISFQILMGDSLFIDMFGLQIMRDNHTSDEHAVYMTQQALKETGLDENATVLKLGDDQAPIAGTIKDFRLGNIISRPLSAVLVGIESKPFYPWHIIVETQGDEGIAFKQISETYTKITGLDFTGKYITQQIEESFAEQKRLSKIVSIFSVIAVLISLMGLLAMSTYFIQQQTKGVAIRKVMGAENKEILTRLVGTFLSYVGIAFVIATPIIWYAMHKWLSGYSYRISLSPLIFIAAGLFCFLISFITVYWQSLRAANANPVESLKSE